MSKKCSRSDNAQVTGFTNTNFQRLHSVITEDTQIEPDASRRHIYHHTITVRQFVKMGEQIMVNIPIEGDPTPKASWFGGEQQLKNNQRTTINTTATETSLLIRNAVQEDSGTYELILDNEAAKKTFKFFVVVFCLPGDIDQVKVSEINATSCLLSWNPPNTYGQKSILGFSIDHSGLFVPTLWS